METLLIILAVVQLWEKIEQSLGKLFDVITKILSNFLDLLINYPIAVTVVFIFIGVPIWIYMYLRIKEHFENKKKMSFEEKLKSLKDIYHDKYGDKK